MPNLSGSEHGGFEGQFGMLPVLDKKKKKMEKALVVLCYHGDRHIH